MDQLIPGVDNIRHDVLISPGFHEATTAIIKRILSDKADISDLPGLDTRASKEEQKEAFRQLYAEVMKNMLNRANTEHNFEIYLLANVSIIKFIIQEFQNQFSGLIDHLKDSIKYLETKHGYTPKSTYGLTQKMGDIQKSKKVHYKDIIGELIDSMQRIHKTDLNKMLESLFGEHESIPAEFFFNPLLQTDEVHNERLLMDQYNLILGDRADDPDKYESLVSFIFDIFSELDSDSKEVKAVEEKRSIIPSMERDLSELTSQRDLLLASKEKQENGRKGFLFKKRKEANLESVTKRIQELDNRIEISRTKYQNALDAASTVRNEYNKQLEKWICNIENIRNLFDVFRSEEYYLDAKRKKSVSKKALQLKKDQIKLQHELLNFLYRKFDQAGLVNHIITSNKMIPVIPKYAPPLNSRQVINFVLDSKERKKTVEQLERFYPGKVNLEPLKTKVKEIKSLNKTSKEECLLNFMIDFARYFRDRKNYENMINLMDQVNLLEKHEFIELSKVNKTLYELFLPDEEKREEGGISSHVVLKADVRGSTKITVIMNERGLNPASHFSMNFFLPISEILPLYDATKIFVEGDAYILSIFEKPGSKKLYSVARACGLAQHMLRIIRRYNEECIKNKLPILELGIGICFRDSSPMFLFDGDNRIMISPALNHSDRLSGCSKAARKLFADKNLPFNLYVFQTVPDEELEREDPDKSLIRYNVNGIQLSEEGFVKLSNEISLRCFELVIPGPWKEKTWIHAGRFPTLSGSYQNLLIRESRVARVDPSDFHFVQWTSRRFFEVCTNPKISQMIEKMINGNNDNKEEDND
ncbi:MAG: hypothetical protein ACMUIM_05230 [bacterium]